MNALGLGLIVYLLNYFTANIGFGAEVMDQFKLAYAAVKEGKIGEACNAVAKVLSLLSTVVDAFDPPADKMKAATAAQHDELKEAEEKFLAAYQAHKGEAVAAAGDPVGKLGDGTFLRFFIENILPLILELLKKKPAPAA